VIQISCRTNLGGFANKSNLIFTKNCPWPPVAKTHSVRRFTTPGPREYREYKMDNAHSIRRSYMISNVMCRGHRLPSFGFHMSIAEAKRALTADSSQ
jgi:hypothetical protein